MKIKVSDLRKIIKETLEEEQFRPVSSWLKRLKNNDPAYYAILVPDVEVIAKKLGKTVESLNYYFLDTNIEDLDDTEFQLVNSEFKNPRSSSDAWEIAPSGLEFCMGRWVGTPTADGPAIITNDPDSGELTVFV